DVRRSLTSRDRDHSNKNADRQDHSNYCQSPATCVPQSIAVRHHGGSGYQDKGHKPTELSQQEQFFVASVLPQ
ncbi:hypothetical protein KAJ02_00660, partial [Candidatus Bipolaricaulota bacterium]|nr:hypothetical protein [Candidatus Bipolaricaulota bacterium]